MIGCNEIKAFETARTESEAILLGELVETRNVIIDTTHHGEKVYLKGTFRVSRSWKTVDREIVSISLPNQATSCTAFKTGETYLIYASQSGVDLFIDANSRSAFADSNSAVDDIGRLGTAELVVSPGEFSLEPSPLSDLLLAFAIAIAISVLVLIWFRRNTR